MDKPQLERYKQFLDLILAYQDSFVNIIAPHLSEEVIMEFTNSFTKEQNTTMDWINENIIKPKQIEQSIITFISNVQKATISEVSYEAKVTYVTAKNYLKRLVKQGKISSTTIEGDPLTYFVPVGSMVAI